MGNFQPISKERAQELKDAISRSRSSKEGLAFDNQTGQCLGSVPLNGEPHDGRGVIGKFDVHYMC